MTLDEAIRHAEEVAEEQEKLYRLCPVTDYGCKGDEYCNSLKNHEYDGCLKCAEEHRQLAEWLKDYKRLLEQTRWIPVTKKLPEYDEDVLCYLKTGEMAVLYRDTQWEQEVWLDGGFGTGSYDVIAWMPLPKPYEPQESEVLDEVSD